MKRSRTTLQTRVQKIVTAVLAAVSLVSPRVFAIEQPIITKIDTAGLNPRLTIKSDLGSTNEIHRKFDLSQTVVIQPSPALP
ncbi:MAG: hypothetical protein L0Z50_08280 [Verrucomicrobiales bacterium]|nr:hypothetical protein [Verrucomicrobiales bacterium]